jgi:hypothetical protein
MILNKTNIEKRKKKILVVNLVKVEAFMKK